VGIGYRSLGAAICCGMRPTVYNKTAYNAHKHLLDILHLIKNAWYKHQDGARGGAVVEALRYKLEGHGFDSRWCHWIFSLPSFRSHYNPGVNSPSNRNEYQEYFLGVVAAGA
jgi:hypothetical protein